MYRKTAGNLDLYAIQNQIYFSQHILFSSIFNSLTKLKENPQSAKNSNAAFRRFFNDFFFFLLNFLFCPMFSI